MEVLPYGERERLAREAFLPMMNALARPGEPRPFPNASTARDALALAGHALLDLETSFFTPDLELAASLERTGAAAREARLAAYHFYTHLDDAALAGIQEASVGDQVYPDRAATLLIACDGGEPAHMTWSGPGIQHAREAELNGIPARFWELRQEAIQYPLGWDAFFFHGGHVTGLPRTTVVEGV